MIKSGINDKMNKPNVHIFHCYAEPLFCNCEICQDCNQFCGVYSYRLQIVFSALLHNFKHIKTRMVMPVDITYMTSYEFLKQINRHHEQITTTTEFITKPIRPFLSIQEKRQNVEGMGIRIKKSTFIIHFLGQTDAVITK